MHSIKFSFYFFVLGFGFSVVENVLFDLEDNIYKDQYAVGPIRFWRWRTLPYIKYVSVFRQPLVDRSFRFEVNLRYKKNKHFNIYTNNNYEIALEMGYFIANKLNVKLLDTYEPNNYKYLDLDELKEKYK